MKQMEYFSIGTTMNVEDLDIMMSSGKLDKQKNEIFDGDIISVKQEKNSERGEFEDYIEEGTYKIIYEDSAFFVVKSSYVKEYLRKFDASDWTMIEFKIIGNIYDTK